MLKTSHSVDYFKQAVNRSELIREQKKDTLPSSSQQIPIDLDLPEGFTIGKAIGGGDCFFDAVAQILRQLKPNMNFTVKSLREDCKIFAESQLGLDSSWFAEALKNDGRSISYYIPRIEFTVDDIKKGSKVIDRLKLTTAMWGLPEIEGRMICSEYNVKLHVIQDLSTYERSAYLIDKFDGLEFKSVSTDYNEKDTIHIISKGGCHFDPVLKKEVQQTLPLSGLTQAHSMLNGLSLEKIYENFVSVIEDYSLSENEKLEKLKHFFKSCPRLDVNFQINDRNDTPLHSAVYKGESRVVKFLLRAGAQVNISNNEGKTPIDTAEESNREDIAKVLQPFVSHKEVNVPGDGSCLFWSVALAYLTPVKFDSDTFCERFKELFTSNYNACPVQRLIQQGNADLYKDNTLITLVTRVFRGEVVNAMYLNREVLKNKINMEDFLESRVGDYFTEGIFKERFKSKFSAEKVRKYGIDISKLQPNFFDKNTIKKIYTELNKIQNCGQIQEFLFEAYLECMKMPKAWGGEHEISVISELLGTAVIVAQRDSEDLIYNEERKHCNKYTLIL